METALSKKSLKEMRNDLIMLIYERGEESKDVLPINKDLKQEYRFVKKLENGDSRDLFYAINQEENIFRLGIAMLNEESGLKYYVETHNKGKFVYSYYNGVWGLNISDKLEKVNEEAKEIFTEVYRKTLEELTG